VARQLTKLKLNEVSAVDSPANKLARIMMFKRGTQDGNYPSSFTKREFTAEERKTLASSGSAMPDGSFPISNKGDLENAIRAIGRAKNPAKAKAHIKTRARALGATDMLPDTWEKRDSGVEVMKFFITKDASLAKYSGDAIDFDTAQASAEECEAVSGLMQEVNEAVCSLGSAIWSIQGDDSVSDKGSAITDSINQFSDHVKTIVPEGVENALVAQALSEAGFRLNSLGGIELSKGDDSTMKAIAKSLGLPETATEAEIITKLTANAEAAKLDGVIAKMSGEEKVFYDKLDKDAQPKFAAMSAEDKKKMLQDAKDKEDAKDKGKDEDMEKMIAKGDAFRSDAGVVLTKKDFGTEAGFQFAKATAAELSASKVALNKAAEESEVRKRTDFAKADLTLVGKAEELGQLLYDIAALNVTKGAAVADRVATVLKGANLLVKQSDIFKEHGRGGAGATGSATEQINKMAADLVAKDTSGKLNETSARVMVRRSNPELRKREEEESKQARKAA